MELQTGRAGISLSGMVCFGRNREEQGCKQGRDSARAMSQGKKKKICEEGWLSVRRFEICQGHREISTSPRQRLIKIKMSTLQCAVKKQNLPQKDLRDVQGKAQNLL